MAGVEQTDTGHWCAAVVGCPGFEHGNSVYENGQMVLQFDKAAAGDATTNDLSHRYLWGAAVDRLMADEQVNWSDGDADGEVLWPLADHLGSVRHVLDSNGNLRIQRQYDAFGNITGETHYNASGSVVTVGQAGYVDEAFAFTGRYLDSDTGLQNNYHRWYDANVGGWISENPLGFEAEGPNLYRYVLNQPINWVDPTGLPPVQNDWTTRQGADSDPWYNDSGWDWLNPWAHMLPLGQRFWIELASTHSIKQRTAEIADATRRMQQEHALKNPQSANPEALRPKASDAEIGLMKDYAEAGIQYNVMVLGGGALRPTITPKMQAQLGRRGWTVQQIDEAVRSGYQVPAINRATGNPATRFVHPKTGQSVVIDNVTGEVIHVGGPGFQYGIGSGDVPLLPGPKR